MKWVLVAIVGIVGVLASVVAAIYLIEPAHSLPSILGTMKGVTTVRYKRGAAAAVVAAVLFVIAIVVALAGRRQPPVKSSN